MNGEAFLDYISTTFNDYLNETNTKRPVILFLDSHSSYMTMELSIRCENLQIIVYILPPNTTHIMQPADVGPFKPFKSYWRKAVREFQNKNPNEIIRRRHVAPLLSGILSQVKSQ